ncbi:transposase [Streptomyces sp. DH37]|uniref:IS701 family transposase n=1 Tax=Streptomyces sp. DH37 TaxID=3040122 RepID=UPI0024421162|nr:transposase [Streptomyces sp. DH37]MDG9706329.1 transposase [Streptomyces sp. DH37]
MRDLQRHADTSGRPAAPPALDAELCESLFGSLQRSDQRAKAQKYVLGLLSVRGRKTLRNIAAHFGGAAAQQNVHHFISTSPWDWMPVRQALARYAHRALAPDAWVVSSLLIPKTGPHSAGVDEQPAPTGQVFKGQHAVGAWLASGRSAVPVHWHLRLSARWGADPLRRRANIPPDAAVGTVEECVRQAMSDVLGTDGVPHGPVVVDVADVDAVSVACFLSSAGIPFVIRADSDTRLRLDRSRLPRHGGQERTAGELADALPHLRQRVNPGDGLTTASAIPVAASPARSGRMLLLGEWGPAGQPRRRVWLTNVAAPASALRLARLSDAVERDFAAISENVGMRDFTGRSFPGWHHHITLASVAHLAVALESPAPARASDTSHNKSITVR